MELKEGIKSQGKLKYVSKYERILTIKAKVLLCEIHNIYRTKFMMIAQRKEVSTGKLLQISLYFREMAKKSLRMSHI
jgi:hypothetical protein